MSVGRSQGIAQRVSLRNRQCLPATRHTGQAGAIHSEIGGLLSFVDGTAFRTETIGRLTQASEDL